MHEYFDDDKYFYIVSDLCVGGVLSDKITEFGNFSEEIAAMVFKEMTESIKYCNSKGLIHNDLTPDSFMFLEDDIKSPLMLIDLGYASILKSCYFLCNE